MFKTVLGLISVALLTGEMGLRALELLGYVWPVVLIGLGLFLVFKRRSA